MQAVFALAPDHVTSTCLLSTIYQVLVRALRPPACFAPSLRCKIQSEHVPTCPDS